MKEFVNRGPATGSGGLKSSRMKISLAAKPVKGGEGRAT